MLTYWKLNNTTAFRFPGGEEIEILPNTNINWMEQKAVNPLVWKCKREKNKKLTHELEIGWAKRKNKYKKSLGILVSFDLSRKIFQEINRYFFLVTMVWVIRFVNRAMLCFHIRVSLAEKRTRFCCDRFTWWQIRNNPYFKVKRKS